MLILRTSYAQPLRAMASIFFLRKRQAIWPAFSSYPSTISLSLVLLSFQLCMSLGLCHVLSGNTAMGSGKANGVAGAGGRIPSAIAPAQGVTRHIEALDGVIVRI